MNATSLMKRRKDMPQEPLNACHGGVGSVQWVGVISHQDLAGKRLRFVHDDVLPPGTSIGVHPHHDDEEYYYILEGCGMMTLDSERFEVRPGDIAAVFPGGEHGLENNSDADLRLIVISVS